jgi:hypothetical protein
MLGAMLIVSLGIVLLLHLVLIWLHGRVTISEGCVPILGVETFLGVAIVAFGLAEVGRVCKDLRDRRGDRSE